MPTESRIDESSQTTSLGGAPHLEQPAVNEPEPFDGLKLPTGVYRHYCMFLLFGVLVLAYADRGIIGVVIESVKQEFELSDLQLGLLTGPAFAIFYATFGIPLARWADIGNRRTVVSLALAIWSVMTALGGMASSFATLFLTRVGVGIGEAGGVAPSHSLGSNYYPPHQHGKVASVLSFAVFVGTLTGLAAGGFLNAQYGWRVTLYALGLPGLLFALLVWLTLSEPRPRTRVPRPSEIINDEFVATVKHLFHKPSFIQILLSFSIISFFASGLIGFSVPFYIRSFGLETDEIGAKLGLVHAASAVIGMAIAAISVDKLQVRHVKWLLAFPGFLCLAALPVFLGGFLAGSFHTSLGFLFVGLALLGIAQPAIFAAIYAVVKLENRSVGLALIGLFVNLLGMGIGPILIGAVSDWLRGPFGIESLRYSLAIFSVTVGWAALHLLLGARHIAMDYEGERPDLAAVRRS